MKCPDAIAAFCRSAASIRIPPQCSLGFHDYHASKTKPHAAFEQDSHFLDLFYTQDRLQLMPTTTKMAQQRRKMIKTLRFRGQTRHATLILSPAQRQGSRMEWHSEERPRDCSDGTRNAEASDLLKARIAELARTKKEIKKAREGAMQSWLDSRPLLDELEKLQAKVESARSRATVSSILVSEVQSQLESTEASFQAKKKDELEATKAVNELTRELDGTRGGMDTLKQDIDEGRRVRQKLKQVLRLKWQRLRALHLGMRAVRIEAEAMEESKAEAAQLMKCAEQEGGGVEMSEEEYRELVRRAEEEESLAEWRITASMEQKQAAEGSRDQALARLREAMEGNRSNRRVKEEEEEEGDSRDGVEGKVSERGSVYPKARARAMAEEADHGGRRGRQLRRTGRDGRKKVVTTKKKEKPLSIFRKMRNFLAKSIAKIFG